MNEKNSKDVFEIDIKRLFNAVWKKIWFVALASLLFAAIALAVTVYLIVPQYQSSAMFYVNNSAFSVGEISPSIDSGDITASKNLVDTYIVILNTRSCLNAVIDYAELDYTASQLKQMITARSVNSTEVFEVIITGADPEEAEQIANAIAYILPNKISDIVEGTSAKVVDHAIVPGSPSSPNRVKNTLVGFAVGFLVSVLGIVLKELFDNTIREEEDIAASGYPILTAVPDMASSSKGGYYGAYGKASQNKSANGKQPVLVGAGISFAAAEAYKLLRTKIEFSFTDDSKCRVLGVSSALTGEGKSLSSVNLAYAFAQLGKKVLLIDCDMRRPSLAVKLNMQRVPGLSNYLAGMNDLDCVLRVCGEGESEEIPFHVITAGRVPPNPIELLSSAKMQKFIETLRECYDYIILDLPPVGEVSDAIVAAKQVDGMLLVVCQNYCTRNDFAHAVEQFEFVNSRIIGVVMNRINENGGRYGYRYGKKYYKNSKYSYTSKNEE